MVKSDPQLTRAMAIITEKRMFVKESGGFLRRRDVSGSLLQFSVARYVQLKMQVVNELVRKEGRGRQETSHTPCVSKRDRMKERG